MVIIDTISVMKPYLCKTSLFFELPNKYVSLFLSYYVKHPCLFKLPNKYVSLFLSYYVKHPCLFKLPNKYISLFLSYLYCEPHWWCNGWHVDLEFTLSTGFHEFEPRLCQTKDYEIGICYFFTNHRTLRSKSKDWLAQNQDIELSNMSICELQNNIPTST